jgi:hypothetical protein
VLASSVATIARLILVSLPQTGGMRPTAIGSEESGGGNQRRPSFFNTMPDAPMACRLFLIGLLFEQCRLGVAMSVDQNRDLAGLLMAADRALYRAKANGRNRVEHASGVSEDQ